jgi:hypothetical protein
MFVYFLKAGDHKKAPIKIGIASNITSRINSLQTGCPYELICIAQIKCESRAEAQELEKTLHSKFSKYCLRGEWFSSEIKLSHIHELNTDRKVKRANKKKNKELEKENKKKIESLIENFPRISFM